MADVDSSKPREEHPFALYIRTLGKGKTGTRSLSQAEARDAFTMVLRGQAEALQVGAFLMLLRVKEESPEELAGFVEACRAVMAQPPATLQADLDWSSYAGKKHQHPWYILAMLLLAGAGYRIFVHGSRGHMPARLYTEDSMAALGLPVASSWPEVAQQLEAHQLSYLPLAHICPPLQSLMLLRPLLGLRSPVNTLTRMLNPLRAKASLQSIFHPAYARLHQEADNLLQQPRALVFKGDSGEVEIKPHADTRVQLLDAGVSRESTWPRCLTDRHERVDTPAVDPLRALWKGEERNDYGVQATRMTTAVALLVLEPCLAMDEALTRADSLWQSRDRSRLG
ncbi:MAG: glycosyl transferase family protein [Halioglobus sp.]|nr:glycosyl transferase family protein [Halioglobus sp.]